MYKLFTYGTLRDPATQEKAARAHLGRGASRTPCAVIAWPSSQVSTLSIQYCSPTPARPSTAMLFEVTQEELERLDDYEGEAYQRVSVTLVSKTRAWVYCENPKSSFRIHIGTTRFHP